MKRGFVALVALVMLALLAGCSTGNSSAGDGNTQSKRQPPKPSKPYTLAATPTGHGGHVVVKGRTNLPDGTLVTLLVERNAKYGDGSVRALHLGGDGVRVSGGHFNADIAPSGQMLFATVESGTFGPLKVLSNSVTVCAQVRTSDSDKPVQPKPVMDAIGGMKGKYLKDSPQASKFGDETWLEIVTSAKLPIPSVHKLAQVQGNPVTTSAKVGSLYCVS